MDKVSRIGTVEEHTLIHGIDHLRPANQAVAHFRPEIGLAIVFRGLVLSGRIVEASGQDVDRHIGGSAHAPSRDGAVRIIGAVVDIGGD